MKIGVINIIPYPRDKYRVYLRAFDVNPIYYDQEEKCFTTINEAIIYCNMRCYEIVDHVTWAIAKGMRYFPDMFQAEFDKRKKDRDRELRRLQYESISI